MCVNAYESLCERTGKIMVFCRLKGVEQTLEHICISQKFCGKEDKYVPLNQKRDCKFYEDSTRAIGDRE